MLQSLLAKPSKLYGVVLTPTRELAFQVKENIEALSESLPYPIIRFHRCFVMLLDNVYCNLMGLISIIVSIYYGKYFCHHDLN